MEDRKLPGRVIWSQMLCNHTRKVFPSFLISSSHIILCYQVSIDHIPIFLTLSLNVNLCHFPSVSYWCHPQDYVWHTFGILSHSSPFPQEGVTLENLSPCLHSISEEERQADKNQTDLSQSLEFSSSMAIFPTRTPTHTIVISPDDDIIKHQRKRKRQMTHNRKN